MGELTGIARFTFHDDAAVEDFVRLSRRCLEVVRAQDTGTLEYDVYLDAGSRRAVVVERYRDSQALLEHHAHIGEELMAAVTATATVEGELLGEPDPQLRQMLADGPVRLLTPFLRLEP